MTGISSELVHVLSFLMVFTSFAAVEARNLRHATLAYLAQALLICGLLLAYSVQNEALLYWAATALVTKAVLVPWFLWRATEGADEETEPVIGFGISAVLVIALLSAMYKLTHAHAGLFVNVGPELAALAGTNLAVAFTVFALGIYAMLY